MSALSPRQFGPGGKYTTRFGTPDYANDRYRPIEHEDVEHHQSMLERYGSKPRYVEVVHTASGRRIGAMNWHDEPIGFAGQTSSAGLTVEPGKPTIFKVTVSKNMRRKGMASAMLDHARALEPNLQHSHALSEDGREWARRRP